MLFVWTGDFPWLDAYYKVDSCRVGDAMEVVASLCGDIPEATLSVLEKSPLAWTIELFSSLSRNSVKPTHSYFLLSYIDMATWQRSCLANESASDGGSWFCETMDHHRKRIHWIQNGWQRWTSACGNCRHFFLNLQYTISAKKAIENKQGQNHYFDRDRYDQIDKVFHI